ncbi:MAG: hypothetical protein ACYS5V_14495 [Planctomycetota bacterium]|jgi:hypothetical protein
MRANVAAGAVAAALMCMTIGCGDSAESVSNSEYLLGLLHESWVNARAGLKQEPPDLGPLRGIRIMLTRRAPRRIEKDYSGPNKQKVLTRLKALGNAYEVQIVPKLDLRYPKVELAPGATPAQVRSAFSKLDEEYRRIEALLNPSEQSG